MVLGLIPAWAGKTGVVAVMVTAGRAHPRVGGENEDDLVHGNDVAGSSPRGRGKRRGGPPGRNKGGLIPAWAGKTATCPYSESRGWAHPRVGGENAIFGVSRA